jgi:Tfp pilus assembly protein PilN
MAIQIIPKERERPALWLSLLLYLSVFLLVATAGSYFFLINLQQKTEREYMSLEQQLSELKNSKEAVLGQEIADHKKKIDNFFSIFENRLYTSQVLPLIEKLAHPKVFFSILRAGTDGKITISGATENFQTLGQQMAIFQGEKLVKETTLSNSFLNEAGKTEFVFDLLLDPEVFIKK